jgi:PHS family inorganic phosphate transporter-like MFS transporter
MADGYDLFIVDMVVAVLSYLHPNDLIPTVKSFLVGATFVGIILGQLSFGAAADLLGRRVAGLATASLCIVGCVLTACCVPRENFGIGWQVGICRFILGLGIGGEYPISMAMGVEGSGSGEGEPLYVSPNQRMALNQILFTFGALLASVVFICMIGAGMPLSLIWRVSVLLGTLPSAAALVARYRLPALGVQDSTQGGAGLSNYTGLNGLQKPQGLWKNLCRGVGSRWPVLLGVCLLWALQNFVFFGQGSFKMLICEHAFGNAAEAGRAEILHNARLSCLASCCCFAGSLWMVFTIDQLAIRPTQVVGFLGAAATLIGGGMLYSPSGSGWALMTTMCGWNFFLPIPVIFIYITSTQFPSQIRATCSGLAAASSKVGGLLGTAIFPIAEDAFGLGSVLMFMGYFSILGVLGTMLFTPAELVDPAELDTCLKGASPSDAVEEST